MDTMVAVMATLMDVCLAKKDFPDLSRYMKTTKDLSKESREAFDLYGIEFPSDQDDKTWEK